MIQPDQEKLKSILNQARKELGAQGPMSVPFLLMIIDVKTWKFPEHARDQANETGKKLLDWIERNNELREIFQESLSLQKQVSS